MMRVFVSPVFMPLFKENNPFSGVSDMKTKEMMKRPRCGVRDNVGTSDIAKRKKRYALHGMYEVSDCLPDGLSKNNYLLIYYIRNMSNKSC